MKSYHSKEWLYDAYWIKKMTLAEIAQPCNVVVSVIFDWMKKFNIRRRTKTESNILWHKNKPGLFAGENNPKWKGGKRITSQGYIQIYRPNHPRANARKTVLEHHLIWEEYWGQIVPDGYLIHHVDRNVKNNHITNLTLVTKSYHFFIHVNSSRCSGVAKF